MSFILYSTASATMYEMGAKGASHQLNQEMTRSIYNEIKHIFHIYKKNARAMLQQFDLTLPQIIVLRHLIEHQQETITMNELITSLNYSPSSISTIIRGLELEGIVRSERSTKDRREVNVYVTEKGRQILDPVEPMVQTFYQNSLHALNDEELQTLHTLLVKMKNNLQSMDNAGDN
ncbi:MarR family winged helix-turn-helix transcriptional regulator [Paenibacillus thalictri]|uniref:MarR family transcriptional regulator n=1 Tax=Paenibacillus thalictri TaxID=2527873 RepID=A0A4Q9DP07_9BACL|nr:MarR family transcriptional regulator [Paenibacillus thalictri]TBL76639.1 MarR family transcriptional regulator [Paenibacillus thalictri]